MHSASFVRTMYNCIACYRNWMQIVYIVNDVTIIVGRDPDYPIEIVRVSSVYA